MTTDLRSVLDAVVDPPAEPVALLFSGGTDSLTILWTLLAKGAAVTAYTFHLSYFESADARASRLACAHWKVPQVLVTEDARPKLEQVREVIGIIASGRKTHVEVMYGYRFLLEAVRERVVYSGIQADTLYGSNKNAAIRCGKADAATFRAYREGLLASPDQEGLAQARRLAAHFGKTLVTPYSEPAVREFMLGFSWAEMNRPKQKMPAVRAFMAEFRSLPIYRIDDNMQCGSRLREHLAEVRPLYTRIAKGAV